MLALHLQKPLTRVWFVRILVKRLQISVGRRTFQVKVIFFDILALVAFRICKPKIAFFQDWIDLVS